jgi:ESX secretion-associated protein EspG
MILNWSRATVLAATAFEACWDVLGLGETPWQLEPPRHGLTAATRQAFVAEVTAQLRAARPELPAWMRLLAHPAWSVDVRLRADDLVAGLVAGRGSLGVLAVRHADEIALVDVPAGAAVDAVLDLLGPVHPGRGRPTTVVLADSPTAPEVRAACRDVRMFGQLGASMLDRDGVRTRRMPRVIGFHRTAAGDYRSVRLGPSTVALEPATRARLAADLDELLAAAR